MTQPQSRTYQTRIAMSAAIFLALASAAIIAGWQFRIPALRGAAFGTFVAPNTALCFLCSALSLLLQLSPGRMVRRVGVALGAFVFLFGLATCAEYLLHKDFGIDRIFMAHRLSDWTLPLVGRFAVNTAIGFSIAGLSLVVLRSRTRVPWAQLLAAMLMLLSYLSITGFLLGASVLIDHVMSIHSAVLFGVLSVALLSAAKEDLVLGIVFSPFAGAVASRRMILAVVVLMPVIGLLQAHAERIGLVSARLGIALSVIATVTVFTILALWTAAVLNYTDRKRLETERALLRSSQIATAGRMAASIAHEVNNPLEAITNIVYLLRTTDVPVHIREQYLEAAERELSRVSAIARRTLGFFREDAKEAETNLRELVEGVIGVYTTRLPETVTISTSYCERPVILAKSGEIRQVLLNLIVNAIDALPGHFGQIEVTVREQDDRLLIEVRDNGVGISPENLESIFEPFFTTKTGHGTGLGLWVSKELVLRNGGTIRVASSVDPQNHGTVFQLSFPPAPVRNAASVSVAEKAG